MVPFDPEEFHDEALKPNGIDTIFGVPDSSLSGLLSYLAANKSAPQHIVMANEGGAVALAAGYHLATRKVAMCYMQNSGLTNALNPLQSLAAKEVFGIPMLLMIGWRGKPGIKDEPQHALIGKQSRMSEAERWFTSNSDLQLSRELVVRRVLAHMTETDVSVSSLGGTSRELYMVRKEKGEPLSSNFFCLGAMGHSFAVANGIRLRPSSGKVFCIDGDGSFIMHLGNNAVLADISQPDLVHVVVFNGVHSSTGSQPLTISRDAFLAAANGLSYERKFFVDNIEDLDRAVSLLDSRSSSLSRWPTTRRRQAFRDRRRLPAS
ncbi:hypothetical protein ACCO45_002187 [Purpureocillium lilacinum]|uniref:Uncharacterized protein n=1 Tax=Purpureocillium lilacinum TaxID=33203 RepID=A0ACC4EBX8_PURLI